MTQAKMKILIATAFSAIALEAAEPAKPAAAAPVTPAASAAAPAAVAATAAAPAKAGGASNCESVKATIDEKIKAKGVKAYTLDIVGKDEVKDAKVVGSCEAGAKKITYKRG